MDPIDLDNTVISMQNEHANNGGHKTDTIVKKIKEILQDKRETPENEEFRIELSSESPSTSVLKRILNILFLATGFVLLVGVVVVILYTSMIGR
jgi:hypothetical protein